MRHIAKSVTIIITGFLCLVSASCNEPLEEEVFSQYSIGDSPSESMMTALLNGAYGELQYNGADGHNRLALEETSGDDLWNERGGLSNNTRYFIEFTWDAENPGWFRTVCWNKPYQAIRNVNFLLEAIDGSQLSDELKKQYRAEARFIRATAYTMMYTWFGPVPLRTKTDDASDLGRATDEEMRTFIETEFVESAPDLPLEGASGRATRGAAYGMLTKFLLNSKQWSKVVQYADAVIDLGVYELWSDYPSLFAVDSEGEAKENIFVWPAVTIPDSEGNAFWSHSYPASDYVSRVDGSAPKLSNQRISGTKNRVYDAFYDSFHPDDSRRTLIVSQYIDTNGDVVTQPANQRSPFKYTPDPNADGPYGGNDFPMVRYADILLSKAEALNEISGPTQEALDLINQVRHRAGVPDLTLTDASSKEILRDLILDERGWEFWAEGKRREDLVRHGKLVERARSRPFRPAPNAEEFRNLFPIPQAEIDANPNVVQNPGY